MNNWLKRVRGAVGMGLAWAAGWAVAGVLIGVMSNLLPGLPWDSFFEVFDAPLPTLAIPGFFGGALFSVVLGIAGRRRKFEDLSIPRFAAWGAVGGLLLSLVPAAFSAAGMLTGTSSHSLLQVTAVIGGPFIVLSAISASVSLILARKAKDTPGDVTEPSSVSPDMPRALDRSAIETRIQVDRQHTSIPRPPQ